MTNWTKAIIFFLISMVLAGCSANNASTSTPIPTPEQGKAVFAGQILNLEGKPLSSVPLRLAEVYHDENNPEKGAYVLDTAFSPGTIADENGFFAFTNIKPGEYVLVVGDVEVNNYVIVSEENGKARTWNIATDQIMDIGTLKVPYTN